MIPFIINETTFPVQLRRRLGLKVKKCHKNQLWKCLPELFGAVTLVTSPATKFKTLKNVIKKLSHKYEKVKLSNWLAQLGYKITSS